MQHGRVATKATNSSYPLGQLTFRRWDRGIISVLSLLAVGMWIAGPLPAQAAEASSKPAANAIPATDQSPTIFVDNVEFDFGDKWVGPALDFSYTIHNKGKSTLKITGVYPGCGGCTTVGDYPKEIEAGQSGKFPFVLKTDVMRGIVTKTITIASNDPVTPSLPLRVRGNFRKRIEIVPSVAFFGPIIGDQPSSKVIKIKNNTDKNLELKLNPVKSDRFKFNLNETDPGQAYELRITTLLPHKAGEITAKAVLTSNIPEEKTVEVTATGRIPDRLDLFPATATFVKPQQVLAGRDHVILSFWLNNYGASLIDIKEAAVNDTAIKTVVDTRSPGKNYRIEVTVPINVGIPSEGRVLTIRTNDPEKPVLTAKIMPQAQPQPPAVPPSHKDALDTPSHAYPAETMLGQALPKFSLKTLGGPDLNHELEGKITVLNFVSPTCPWCKKQMPEVEKVRAAFQSKGVRFVNVINPNPGGQHAYTADELTQAFAGTKLEIATDTESKVGALFRAQSYPTLFVIGKDGKVASVDLGYNKVGLLQSQLEAALAGKPIPTGTQPF